MLVSAGARAAPTNAWAKYCRQQTASFHGRRFVGTNDVALIVSRPGYQNCSIGRMAADGVGYFRFPLNWASVEPVPGKFDFRVYDVIIAALASHNIRAFPVLIGTPPWAARHVPPGTSGQAPPARPAQFAAFAAAVVSRYGPDGTFWRYYRVPRMPIHDWQVWNEPNLSYFWPPAPDPRAYSALLASTYRAIKGVDPLADVVSAGMPFTGPSYSALDFYRAMFRYAGVGDFDTLALNDYAPTVASAVRRLFSTRAFMKRHGARRKPLWVTEFGWASAGPPSPYRARGLRDQRAKIAGLMSAMTRDRGRLDLGAAMLWSWADQPRPLGSADSWGVHAGLYRRDLQPKPAAAAFGRLAKRLSR